MSAGCGKRALPHPALRLDARLPVGIDRPAAGFAQRADRLVGVGWRILNVRPVEQRGHAGVERGEAAEQRRGVDVLRPEVGSEPLEQFDEHPRQVPVEAHVADRALPGVAVRIDETRQDQIVGRVEDFDIAGVDARRHVIDLAVSNQNVAGEVRRDGRPS